MFERLPVPPLPSLLARMNGDGAGHRWGQLLPIGVAIALAVSASLVAAAPARAASDEAGYSIQYQEALAHASEHYSFTPGGPVTVPYQPRPGDSTQIDGASPVALPAAGGSAGIAPVLVGPGSVTPAGTHNLLRKEVFGFLPYWELGTTLNYDALSTVAYFGFGLNVDMAGTDPASDGSLYRSGSGWNGWASSTMTTVINTAHAHGTRVDLTVQSFAWDSAGQAAQTHVLSTPAASARAIQQIAAEVYNRGVDGVNLDFEPIASGQSANFIAFVKALRVELDRLHPGYELTFCATGRPSTYDLAGLLAPGAADAVFIMGYDYRGGTPGTTGSIDPMVSPYAYDLTDTINTYMAHVPGSQIILGLPWYGHAWSTGANNYVNAPPAQSQQNLALFGQPASVYYSTASALAAAPVDATHLGKLYDPGEQTAWTAYYGNYGGTMDTWRELYFDDAQSLGVRCDAIVSWGLRGAGIWALGYDNDGGNGDLTAEIAAKFQTGQSGGTFHAIAPSRVLDTRYRMGLSSGLSSHVAQTFHVTGGSTGVPANATAVTGNLTVTGQSADGFLYLGPSAMNDPTSSNLNFPKNDDRANAVTVALGGGGMLWITYAAPTTGPTAQAIFDVTGYFTGDATGATYVALPPTRIVDSRAGIGLASSLSSHAAAAFQVTGGASGVPSGATAVTGNLTVTGQGTLGYLYLGPTAANNPGSSTLNFPKGDDRANAVTVALGTGGVLWITYAAPSFGPRTDVVFDVTGYFTPDMTGATYVPLTPTRLLDSRAGTGVPGAFSSHVAQTFQVTGGSSGIPATASAVTGTLTVTQQTSVGYLYVGPVAANDPTGSNLNFPMGDDRANAVTVALGATGTLSVTYAAPSLGPTAHVIFDVTGYFAP